ncbi:MAG: alanyl-tRNA synthetase [Flavobacteriales bacterium]|jgi:alanyl-tRNA synthetase
MTAKEIRQQYKDFFESKGHKIVHSAPIVVKNDPTLMFNNAGMNQFKNLFLGNKKSDVKRIANSQKCLRVSGKHNDLEEVGVDTYHHTMFEMLGNWSFGDYFKKEAIEWAWELLTEVYKLDKDRLYVTVFEGDKGDKLGLDQEAKDIWSGIVEADQIILADKKDNFWEMGEVGPCGPCSEIHVDLRDQEEIDKIGGKELVNKDHPQVVEIWNLVFMQYNRIKDGSLHPLSAQHIDTGMGFERLVMAMQGKKSNYDTDVFSPLIKEIEKISAKKYKEGEGHSDEQTKTNIAIRVIADHIRTLVFAIADGQLPSNTGAGYVIRRILRRAVRYGYQVLDLKEPFFHKLVDVLAKEMGDAFPELVSQKELCTKVIKEEEISFYRTLEQGIRRMDDLMKVNASTKKIEGKDAFELYDTFGFPFDLTALIASENGYEVSEKDFESSLQEQKDRSKKASKVDTSDWIVLKEDDKEEFIGYDTMDTSVYITRYRKVKANKKEFYQLVFNFTPFYAEGGGQVGDTGFIESEKEKVFITNTKKEDGLILHYADKLPEFPTLMFHAVVNAKKRALTANNHTATHLLHKALQDVLGSHVEQKGSLVNEKYLRFDFSHFSKVTDEELVEIETRVNTEIRKDIHLNELRNTPMKKAQELGAKALFGEKYGDLVRLIQFGDSIELCGGIHVESTGKIGSFKLISESSTAAGIRRIEAITSEAADKFVNDKLSLVLELNQILKLPKDLKKAVEDLIAQNSKLGKEIEKLNAAKAGDLKGELIKEITEVNGVNFLAKKVDLDAGGIKKIAFQMKSELDNLFLVLCNENNGKANITILVSEELSKSKDLHAGNIVRVLAKEINGGGGGQPFFASAGGSNPAGIPKVFELAKKYID